MSFYKTLSSLQTSKMPPGCRKPLFNVLRTAKKLEIWKGKRLVENASLKTPLSYGKAPRGKAVTYKQTHPSAFNHRSCTSAETETVLLIVSGAHLDQGRVSQNTFWAVYQALHHERNSFAPINSVFSYSSSSASCACLEVSILYGIAHLQKTRNETSLQFVVSSLILH